MKKEKIDLIQSKPKILAIFTILLFIFFIIENSITRIVKKFSPDVYDSLPYMLIDIFIYFAMIISCILIVIFKSHLRSKFFDCLNKYKYHIAFCVPIVFIFSILCFNENRYKLDEMKEIINIQWTIYAIVSALYLFWHGFTIDKIEKSVPKYEKTDDAVIKYFNVREDMKFYNNHSGIITPIILLGLNTFHLLATTYIIYIEKNVSILTQNIVMFGIVLNGNSLVFLMLEIITFEFKFKKEVVDKRFVSYDEIVETKEAAYKDLIVSTFKSIMLKDVKKKIKEKDPEISNEKRDEIISKFFEYDNVEKMLIAIDKKKNRKKG